MAESSTLDLRFGRTVYDFLQTAATGTAREVAAFGTRGDGKTWGALGTMVAHAKLHHAAGYPLPCKWLGVADTFASHKAKTHDSLTSAGWQGLWRLHGEGHIAEFVLDGTVLVSLRLFGVEDQSGMDRLRAESHGMWFEEPAPASLLVQSSGLSASAWGLGLTSLRLPSHCNPAIMTLNYPDADHWTWQRFVVRKHPGTAYFRIPPGERASPEDRARWREALVDRPDMLRRLLEGQPGVIMLGAQVAQGFNVDSHVAYEDGPFPLADWGPICIGQDGGLTPTSIIGQRQHGRIAILASLASERAGMRQHVEYELLPWLEQHAPWALGRGRAHELIQVWYDPSLDTDDPGDIESNPFRVMRQLLPGVYHAGPTTWEGRNNPMLALFNRMVGGVPALTINGLECLGLIKALDGGWYYPTTNTGAVSRDLPKKPNHPHEDYGDAFCYLVAGLAPTKDRSAKARVPAVTRVYDVLDHGRPKRPKPIVKWH